MSDKKFVCNVDGRRFKTAAALKQHRVEKHGGGPKSGSRRAPPSSDRSAPVSLPMSIKSKPTEGARLTGSDRIDGGEIVVGGLTPGKTFFSLQLSPAVFNRMLLVSRAFQRYRIISMRFRFEPQVPTTCAGGYVIGFISDPDDDYSNYSLDQLCSLRGTVATKWWQDSSIVVPSDGTWFYCSTGTERRTVSPGTLLIMCDGRPTVAGSYSLYCDWSVEFKHPAYEKSASPNPPDKQIPIPEFWNDDLTSVPSRFGVLNARTGKCVYDVGKVIPGAIAGDWYKLQAPITLVPDDNNRFIFAKYLYCKDATNVVPANGPSDDQVYDDFLKWNGGGTKAQYTVANRVTKMDKPPKLEAVASVEATIEDLKRQLELLQASLPAAD